MLGIVGVELCALAEAVLGCDEKGLRFVHDIERAHLVAFAEIDAANTCCGASHAAHFVGIESRTDAVPGDHEDVFAGLDEANFHQGVAFVDGDGADAVAVDVLELPEKRLLDGAVLRDEHHIDIAVEATDRQEAQHLLAFLEIEEVHQRPAEARARRFRNLERILEEESARIGEEHERVVRFGDKHEA